MTASHACPTCGHQNRLGAKFCQQCGAHFDSSVASSPLPASGARPPQPSVVASASSPDAHYCVACRREVAPEMLFCRHCGTARQPTAAPDVPPTDQKNGRAPASAGPSLYQPTIPLPVRLSAAPAVKSASPLTGKAKASSAAPVRPPLAVAPATDYQLGPPLPARAAWPGWLWFLFGLLAGILLAVAVLQYGPELLRTF